MTETVRDIGYSRQRPARRDNQGQLFKDLVSEHQSAKPAGDNQPFARLRQKLHEAIGGRRSNRQYAGYPVARRPDETDHPTKGNRPWFAAGRSALEDERGGDEVL